MGSNCIQRDSDFVEMSSEAQETLLDLEYCDQAAAEISEPKNNLVDLTHRNILISRAMKISFFAKIVFGIICVVLLSLFLSKIKEQSTNSDVSRGQDHSETSTKSELNTRSFLCSFSAIGIHLLPATAVIVSEEGYVTMSDADTTVNPESTLTVRTPTSTTSVTPIQRNDSDLGIRNFNKFSVPLHYVSIIMQL